MLRQKAGLDRIRLEGAHMEVLVCDDNYETVEKISNIVEMYCQEKGKTLMITKNTRVYLRSRLICAKWRK